jgi:His-Xaa-Ser system protein HxsD
MAMQLQLDGLVYSIEAVQKATYRFIDRFSAVISLDGQKILINLSVDEKHISSAESIVADFHKELIDQNLRLKIKAETESVRNLILAYTFSKTGLQG